MECTTHYKAFLGSDREEDRKRRGGREDGSVSVQVILCHQVWGWALGDGKGLQLGQEIGDHFFPLLVILGDSTRITDPSP